MDFGVTFPSKISDYNLVMLAEEVGFQQAWFFDSQMIYSDVYATMALAAHTTKKIKLAITGKGTASKEQVAAMLKSMLNIKETPKHLDASDGLAAAVCHHFQRNTNSKERSYKGWGAFLKNNPEKLK